MMSKCRAGNEVRTRDIQLGKLASIGRKPNNPNGCSGKNQASYGLGRVRRASDVWDGVWEGDPLEALRRVTVGGAS